jgi:predicted permease
VTNRDNEGEEGMGKTINDVINDVMFWLVVATGISLVVMIISAFLRRFRTEEAAMRRMVSLGGHPLRSGYVRNGRL